MSDVPKEVLDRIKSDRVEVQARIRRLEKALPSQTKAADRLWAKLLRLPDDKTDPKLGADLEAAQSILWNTCDGLSAEKRRLALLDDPAEVERRVEVHQNLLDQEEAKMARKATAAKNLQNGSTRTPQETIDLIVKMVDEDGLSLSGTARKLTEDGVPTPGKSSMWHPPVVRALYLKATGKTSHKHVVPAAKDQPAKPAVKLPNGNGAKAKAEVKPDPKPKSEKKSAPRKRAPRKAVTKA